MTRASRIAFRIIAVSALVSVAGCAGVGGSYPLGDILGGSGGALDEPTVAAGLKEALRVGTERTVASTGKVDGFFANQLIRIVMPEELESAAAALRTIGMRKQVDEFELAMNRAAEKSAGEAADVFWGAIKKMTIAEAFDILGGEETAATDYFRAHTSDELRRRFGPIVTDKMGEVGLYNAYNGLMDRYTALPLVEKPVFDLDEYITERALSGMFTVLASEEKRIREDPAARTTELLRKVFGRESE
ncbi:MAG: DUF4197 domain-containing protein [Candidatus Eisenbacteria bacterium]